MNLTRSILVGALLLVAPLSAQEAATKALDRARLIEEQEGDLAAAEKAYRALLDDPQTAPAVRVQATLRLGALLQRLGRQDEASALLEPLVAGGGEAGASAQAILSGQSGTAQQEQELRARAATLTDRAFDLQREQQRAPGSSPNWQETWNQTTQDLLWLGEPAARAIAAELERLRDHSANAWQNRTPTEVAVLANPERIMAGLLWRIGTPAAQEFFAAVAGDPSVVWRRQMVAGCGNAANTMLPVAARFLNDDDPDGEVQRNVMQISSRFDPAVIRGLLRARLPQARAAGYEGLAQRWRQLQVPEREQLLEQVGPDLRLALGDPDPRVSRAAWQFLHQFGTGPRAARRFLLEELPRWPTGLEGRVVQPGSGNWRWPLDDAELELLLAAARSFGPDAGHASDPRRNVRDLVADLVGTHEPAWSANGVPTLLELFQLGYGGHRNHEAQWIGRCIALATPDQVVALIRLLPELGRPLEVLMALGTMDLSAAAFPPLRDQFDRWLASPPDPSRGPNLNMVEPGGTQTRNGVQVSFLRPGTLAHLLLGAIGRTASPEAPAWLSALVDRQPVMADAVAHPLVQLSLAGLGEPVLAALRRLLVWEGTPEVTLRPSVRDLVFAELARRGDLAAISLFPRAVGLGLQGTHHPRKPTGSSWSPLGAGWLGLIEPGGGIEPGTRWHGYAPEPLAEAWRLLLTGEQTSDVLQSVAGMRHLFPREGLPALAEALLTLPQPIPDQQVRNAFPVLLHTVAMGARRDQVEAGMPLRALLGRMLARPDMIGALAQRLPPDVLPLFEAELRAALATAEWPQHYARPMLAAGLEPTTAEWTAMLRHRHASEREFALDALRTVTDPVLQREVTARLQDDEASVRAKACALLARQLSTDAVPALLRALRDPAEIVRKEATEALQRIRFYQDEQGYWQQVEQGVTTGREAATAKLLVQARPGAPREQRLLAIRSLGALGAPEALPYLIEWSQQADAEIAAAARSAIGTIHQQAGVK